MPYMYCCVIIYEGQLFYQQNQNNFISEIYNVSKILIALLLVGANSRKPI